MAAEAVSLQVGELCRRLRVPMRHARYVLEQGVLPQGVEKSPDRGNHRILNAAQAFWLAIVLKLKEIGVSVPAAGRVADFAREAMQIFTTTITWDPDFAPFDGRLGAAHRWLLEIGDLQYGRVVTNADPGSDGFRDFGWVNLVRADRRQRLDLDPVVTIQLDLTQIAGMLLPRQRGRSVIDM